MNSGMNMPLSQIFKLLVLTLLLCALVIRKRIDNEIAVSTFYLTIFLASVMIYTEDIGATLIHLTKLLSLIILFVYFRLSNILFKSQYLNKAFKVLKVGFYILILNLGAGLLGFGFHTYGNIQMGQKGFFYAGNEVGGLVISLFPFALFYCYFKYSNFKYIIFSIILIILSISLATKTVMLATLISIFAIPVLYSSWKTRSIAFIFLLVTIYIGYIHFIQDNSNPIIDKLSWEYNQGGINKLIFSDRDEFFNEKYDLFSKAPLCQQLLGLGGGITVEMDYFDILLNYGYLGLLFIFFIIITFIYILYKNRNNNIYFKCLIFQDSILLIVSFLAGHLLFSSMASIFIAITNSIMFIKLPSNVFLSKLTITQPRHLS